MAKLAGQVITARRKEIPAEAIDNCVGAEMLEQATGPLNCILQLKLSFIFAYTC